MKTIKYLVLVGLTFTLAVSLLAGACAPAAPSGSEGAAEIAALEADLAAEEAKVASLEGDIDDLEDDIAALNKPAKVYRWEPSTHIAAGLPWEFLVYMAEDINALSDGRMVITPSQPGALCPVEEQMEAVSDGTTSAMAPTPSYYAGKFPMASVYNTSIGLPTWVDMVNAYEVFQDGRARDIYYETLEELYNVAVVGERIGPLDAIMSSNVPIPRISSLQGMKFRCGDDHFAGPLNALGASTVWFPGSEIYTGMATGVVDAFTYNSAYDHYSLSFHEVSKYWLKWPSIMGASNEQFVINREVWNELPDDLKLLVSTAIEAADYKQGTSGEYLISSAWKAVEDYGIVAEIWPEEDAALWIEKQMEHMKQYEADPKVAEFLQIIKEYDELMGIL